MVAIKRVYVNMKKIIMLLSPSFFIKSLLTLSLFTVILISCDKETNAPENMVNKKKCEEINSHFPRNPICNNSNMGVAMADAEGAWLGAKIGSRSRNPYVTLATALGLAIYASMDEYKRQQDTLQPLMTPTSSDPIGMLLEEHPFYINPYHPIYEPALHSVDINFSTIGIFHNQIIQEYFAQEDMINLFPEDRIQNIMSLTSTALENFSNQVADWEDYYYEAISNYETSETNSEEEINYFIEQYVERSTNSSYQSFSEYSDSIMNELDNNHFLGLPIPEETSQPLLAYFSTFKWSRILWRPLAPRPNQGMNSVFITENEEPICMDGNENIYQARDSYYSSSTPFCLLYPIYGQSSIEAFCFYNEENTLFTPSELDFLTIEELDCTSINTEPEHIYSGTYPVHYSSSGGFYYILLSENVN